MAKFFAELKRRYFYRIGVGYRSMISVHHIVPRKSMMVRTLLICGVAFGLINVVHAQDFAGISFESNRLEKNAILGNSASQIQTAPEQ